MKNVFNRMQFYSISLAKQKYGLVGLITGMLLIAGGFIFNTELSTTRFWYAWQLYSISLVMLALSGLVFISIHSITGAKWSDGLLPVALRLSSLLPISSFLFLLSLAGQNTVFPDSGMLINIIRSIVAIGCFSLWNYYYFQFSAAKSGTTDLKKLSIGFLATFTLSWSVFCWLWLMAMIPGFFSTLFAFYLLSSMLYGGFAMIILLLYIENKNADSAIIYQSGRYFLALAFFWAYLWYCQYLIIRYAGIPTDTPYLTPGLLPDILRLGSIILGFILPLILLLRKSAKQNLFLLAILSVISLMALWFDLFNFLMASSVKISYPGLTDSGLLLIFTGITIIFFPGTGINTDHKKDKSS